MGDSPQVEVINENANKIANLIKGNLTTIANDLKWVKLLNDQNYDEIVDTRGNPPLQRANTLIRSVIAQVEVDPAWYEVFRGVLEKHLNPEVLRKILPKLGGEPKDQTAEDVETQQEEIAQRLIKVLNTKKGGSAATDGGESGANGDDPPPYIS